MACWLRATSSLQQWANLGTDPDDYLIKHQQAEAKAIAAAIPPKRNKRPKRRRKKHGGPLDPSLLSADPRIGKRTANRLTRQNANTLVDLSDALEPFHKDLEIADASTFSRAIVQFFDWSRSDKKLHASRATRERVRLLRARHQGEAHVPRLESAIWSLVGTQTDESGAWRYLTTTPNPNKDLDTEAVAAIQPAQPKPIEAASQGTSIDVEQSQNTMESTSHTNSTEAYTAKPIDKHCVTTASRPAPLSLSGNNAAAIQLRKAVLRRLVGRARFAAKRARIVEKAVQTMNEDRRPCQTSGESARTADFKKKAALNCDGGLRTRVSSSDEDGVLVLFMGLLFLCVALTMV
ncbi:hypothetical protein LTR86_003323 [Recurvomyces mirabilis]|nr:hypothetical protein LTR86_003323 [Recurvomyces mirabilis]